MKNLLKEASVDEYSKGTKDLHLLILSKCHRVPIDSTIEELRNPSGILYSEYKRIQEKLSKKVTLNENNRTKSL